MGNKRETSKDGHYAREWHGMPESEMDRQLGKWGHSAPTGSLEGTSVKSERSLCRRLRLSPRGSPSFREMDGDRRLPTRVGQSGPDRHPISKQSGKNKTKRQARRIPDKTTQQPQDSSETVLFSMSRNSVKGDHVLEMEAINARQDPEWETREHRLSSQPLLASKWLWPWTCLHLQPKGIVCCFRLRASEC